jgi:hypothetical protein
MAVELVLRNGTAAENDAFIGALAEVTVDKTNNTLRVHDGTTTGGFQTASVTGTQTLSNKTLASPEFTGQITGDLIPSSDVTFDLGSATNRWNDLFLSGSTINLGGATISVVGGSFEFKDSGGNDTSVSLAANDTDDLSEGSTNLYYTDARVDAHLSGGTGVTFSNGNISIGQAVDTTDNVTFNDLVVSGDLTVSGTTTTINTTTLDVEDINITVANGAADATSANGAGLTADLGTDGTATFTYDSANDRWSMNKSLATNLTGDVTGTVSDISNHDTDDLTEGTTNLYYTDARVDAHLSGGNAIDYNAGTISVTANAIGTDELNVAGTGSAGEALLSDGDGSLSFGAAGATITDDTSTNSSFYPTLTDSTSGSFTDATVSSTKLFFNPSSGTLNATVFNSVSDERRKKNIRTLDSALDKTLSLRGVSYTFKDTDVDSIGLIAQELEEVIPEVVSTGDDGLKSVSYGNLVGLLVEAIKDQQNQIDELKNKVYK